MEVRRVNERIMVVTVRVDKTILNLISVYAPQVGKCMEEIEVDTVLENVMLEIREKEKVMLGEDLNGRGLRPT